MVSYWHLLCHVSSSDDHNLGYLQGLHTRNAEINALIFEHCSNI